MSVEQKAVLTLSEVVKLTSLSKPTIYKYRRDGGFPQQIRIGPNRVVWLQSEVLDWLDRKAEARAL